MALFFLRKRRWFLPVLVLWIGVAGLANGANDPHAVPRSVAAPGDADNDGVADERDLCPNTPAGTPVNAYGCPTTSATCSYSTASITLNSVGGSGGGTVRYVLADSTGTIVQVSSTPTFSGLTGSRTYMALSISHDGSVTNLTAGQSLSAVSATCYDWSDALVLKACVSGDTDGDGIVDERDLCPNTPAGTPVNAYGCPKTLATCDYNTSSITLTSSGGSGNGTVQYVLADSVGTIVRVANTSTFSGLSGSHTYMALAISHDGTVTGLTAGQSLSVVSAGCYNWSNALVIKVCIPTPALCDYSIGANIAFKTTGGSTGTGTLTRYLLVDATGQIVRLANSPTFATSGLSGGAYAVYSLVYTDDQSLTNLAVGQLLANVRANCLALSSPLSIRLCTNCVPKCVPVVVVRIRSR